MARAQWVCPQCGRRLNVPNQEHACGPYDLESHFHGKDPIGRRVFEWILETSEKRGPIEVLPMKTMIGFQARSNFAFIVTKKKGVELSLLLSEPATHPKLCKVDPYGAGKAFHRFRTEVPDDLDPALGDLLANAFAANA